MELNMGSLLFIFLVILPFLIFMVPGKTRDYYVQALTLFIVLMTSFPALSNLLDSTSSLKTFQIGSGLYRLILTIDPLSAFFLLVVNFTALTGILYSKSYLRFYKEIKSPVQFALHYFSYTWLHLSMIGVLLFHDGIPFMIAWEMMAVSSFLLILFEAEKRDTLKTAVNYLIQMHVGLALLVIGFLICEVETGQMNFESLFTYFSHHPNTGLFFLFFSGFAIKAGFIPFHTWLPEAHPAAPSHVSGVMSGVMIKMGIYGILRVLTYVQSDIYIIGSIILVISALSGLLGVMFSIVQKDIKRVLAYCSIENIGIIGIGIGVGTMGLGSNNSMLVLLGYGGALLHVMNHSLAKSLLFFSAGSLYQACHTRNIDQLGGVIHKMPKTAGLFLVGSIAICGLPPLNGFISEILIYYGLFIGLSAGTVYQSIMLLLTTISFVLMGGLSIFTFTKTFGITFLGSPRKEMQQEIKEASTGMLFPQYLITGAIVTAGLFPILFIRPVVRVISFQFHRMPDASLLKITDILTGISLILFVLLVIFLVLSYFRFWLMKRRQTASGPTWGCGYTAATSRQQYTGTSYAANFAELAAPVLQTRTKFKPFTEENIFPGKHSFSIFPVDVFQFLLQQLIAFVVYILKKLARLQTGNIQHYILYAFVFILVIFLLLYLHLL
jgi:hydrogenase-4 component B